MKIESCVIKFGGHAMDDESLKKIFFHDLASVAANGEKRLVLVHGGGPFINAQLSKLEVQSRFVDGLRVTDEAVMQVVEMVLCGQVNKALTAAIEALGVPSAGISGRDGGLLQARIKRPELGLVGEITKVNPGLLECLLGAGYLPVIASVAAGPDWEALNVNADTAAGAIAGALEADIFILVSDVPGVLDDKGNVLTKLDKRSIEELKASGAVSGGMLPKLEACLHAISSGCKCSLILDGSIPGALGLALNGSHAPGTLITA